MATLQNMASPTVARTIVVWSRPAPIPLCSPRLLRGASTTGAMSTHRTAMCPPVPQCTSRACCLIIHIRHVARSTPSMPTFISHRHHPLLHPLPRLYPHLHPHLHRRSRRCRPHHHHHQGHHRLQLRRRHGPYQCQVLARRRRVTSRQTVPEVYTFSRPLVAASV